MKYVALYYAEVFSFHLNFNARWYRWQENPENCAGMQLIHALEFESISPYLTAPAGVQFGEVHPDRFHGHPSDTGALGRTPVKCWTPAGAVGKG